MGPYSIITNLLSKDQLAALGRVAANSAHLEWALGWVLMWCLKLSDTQRTALLTDMMFRERLGLLQRQGKEKIKDPQRQKAFKNLIKRMSELYGHRNTVIHGTWDAGGAHIKFEDALDMEFGFRPAEGVTAKNQKNARTYSAKELIQLADDLHNIKVEMWDFCRDQWWKTWTKEIWNKQAKRAKTTKG